MAQITLTGAAVISLDGQSYSEGSSFTIDCDNVSKQTKDVTNTYMNINVGRVVYVVIANIGDDDVIVRGGQSPNYIRFGIPVGGHLCIPGNDFDSIAIRSVTSGGSRVSMVVLS